MTHLSRSCFLSSSRCHRFNCTPARVVAYEVERPPPPAASVSSMEGVLTELAQGMGWLASQISGQWERNHAGYAPLMNELEIGKYNEVGKRLDHVLFGSLLPPAQPLPLVVSLRSFSK